MATESRRADPSLEHVLFEEGYRFDFFQAVRVLERLYSARLPVGRSSIPAKEAVRFRSLLSLSFPPSSIYDVAYPDNGDSPPEMVVAFMGLFGLATLTVTRRTKEIGIRKVLGASALQLVQLLSKDFLLLVVIASVIAFPVAWWAMQAWLSDFAYRTQIVWWIFLVAGIASIVVAFVTISTQAIKAAMANPVKSLRTE